MSISQLALSISESPTLKLNEAASKLSSQGEAVIHLGIGEPQNQAPIAAILQAMAALKDGSIKYGSTGGQPALKQAIVECTAINYHRQVTRANVIVSNGAKHSLFNVLSAVIDPGDEVILLAPYWVSYPEMVKLVGGKIVVVTAADGGFIPKLTEIETALTARTKAILLNNPNNPSGTVYPESLIAGLVELCETRDIDLIMDDIYHKLIFDNEVVKPGYDYSDLDVEESKIIIVNGVSKTYGMTGFRIGWAVARQEIIKAMNKIQGQTTSCAHIVSQAAAQGALTGPQDCVEQLRLSIQNNRNVLLQEMATLPGVKVYKPGGTFYCFPDFSAINPDSEALAAFLLQKARVVTVPGKAFGKEGHLRISFAGSMDDILEGMKRIRWALDSSAPQEIIIGDRRAVRDWK